MAYSITTKDGITINNIPDNVKSDDPSLKARVAEIRASRVDVETGKPMDIEIPTTQTLSRRGPYIEPERTFKEKAIGAGEAALSTATQLAAPLTALATYPGQLGKAYGKGEKAPDIFKAMENVTYAPRTPVGQEYTGAVNELLQESGIQGLVGMPVGGPTLPKVPKQKPGITANVLGATTGTGAEAISQAYKAGKAGGEKGKVFIENLRQEVPVDLVLQDAKDALAQMKANKSADYVANKTGWAADTTRLDFTPIKQSFNNLVDSLKEQGKWKIGKEEVAKIQEVERVVKDWEKTPSLHTTVGLDALKQRIDAIYPDSPKQSQAQRVITGTSGAVKKAITDQASDYATAMKDYETMSATIRDIESALSLGNQKSKDAALRKLQSLTRNNVQTNYGGRLDMLKQLEQTGGENIMPAVAGQALSSLLPRGLAGQSGASLAAIGGYFNPATLSMLPATSPRLVGETAFKLGQTSNYLPSVPKIPYRQAPYAGVLGFPQEEQ
jgi:hypothetical protein